MAEDTTRLFAILMPWGRVGSNLVTAALVESANIHIDNEPTTRLKTLGQQKGWSQESIGARQFEQLAAFHQANCDTGDVAGLKLSHRSLIAPREYAQTLRQLGFRPIIMVRNNFLKCAVSQLRAVARAEAPFEQQRAWRSPWAVGATEAKPGPMSIDSNKAIQLVREFEQHHCALLDTASTVFGQDAVQIEYSELSADPAATLRRIFIALKLTPPKRIRVPHKKATSDQLSEDITNYTEFAAAIRAAGMGHFLAEC
ncbi:Uncharacterised protein [Halioglobus japonicus]|nr:Uncharacterised protein [Halioglobus japonicus]